MTTNLTHRRNTGAFGFGLRALCGATEGKMATNTKYVKCPRCLRLIAALRRTAKERLAAL